MVPSVRAALFQPDIPQNLGAAIRLCACLDVALGVIEPCAFPLSDKALRRAALDYGDPSGVLRFPTWADFVANARPAGRIIVVETNGAPLPAFTFAPGDVLVLGAESAGFPEAHLRDADGVVRIPMRPGARSLNVVTALAIALGEALRQTGGWDELG
jgi:tRNA (cytidine/uridine-2'-O-)-methyltransferase